MLNVLSAFHHPGESRNPDGVEFECSAGSVTIGNQWIPVPLSRGHAFNRRMTNRSRKISDLCWRLQVKFQGNLTIARPVEKVWDFLWDIEKSSRCIPGCQQV